MTWTASSSLILQQLRQFVDESMRVEADGGGEIEEFDDVQPALSRLDVGDERLVTSDARPPPRPASSLDLRGTG